MSTSATKFKDVEHFTEREEKGGGHGEAALGRSAAHFWTAERSYRFATKQSTASHKGANTTIHELRTLWRVAIRDFASAMRAPAAKRQLRSRSPKQGRRARHSFSGLSEERRALVLTM